jgi:DNA-binding response OmpR family regulator
LSIRVLLADDDIDFLDVTAYALRRAGFVVSTVSNGEDALETWRVEEPDIVLLDVGMPSIAGTQVCQAIRTSSSTPVVLLSGTRRESDIIRGFEAGADDYLTKPFSIQHLVMRLRAIHRRASGQTADVIPKHLVVEPLVIDLDSFGIMLDGRPVQLTRLEFRLLYCLAANVGRVVATSRLIDFAWGLDGEGDGSLLKTHVSHIRRKLREVSDWPITIRAFPGVGYSLHIGSEHNPLN